MSRPYLQIKQDIISCRLRPGQITNESECAARYRVSRTVVREALQALRHEGFVESVPRVGYVVTQLTVKEFLDLFGARAIVEPAAVALAAENAGAEEIERIRELAEAELQWEGEETYATLNHKNSEFHGTVAGAAHNLVLASIQVSIMEKVERLFNLRTVDGLGELWSGWRGPLTLQQLTVRLADRQHEQHVAIADAISGRDGRKAAEIALLQVEASRQRVLDSMFGDTLTAGLSVGRPVESSG